MSVLERLSNDLIEHIEHSDEFAISIHHSKEEKDFHFSAAKEGGDSSTCVLDVYFESKRSLRQLTNHLDVELAGLSFFPCESSKHKCCDGIYIIYRKEVIQ